MYVPARVPAHAQASRSAPARAVGLAASVLVSIAGLAGVAAAQPVDENPPVMLQWFETKWSDIERRMPDFFKAGYGSVWLPPTGRAYVWPGSSNQNSTSVGYDVHDRFDLGKPNAQTAYGTESGFDAMVAEFHRADALVFIDTILNHNGARQGSSGFQLDGGYPGFWMAPGNPPTLKQPTSNWGDFHAGVSGGYRQSEDPGGPRYCLLTGDLVALIDINPSSNNQFIRQPTAAGNPLNIPAGIVFNRPDPDNARFYPDTALGVDTINNPGMGFAGPLNTGVFSPPCDIPARNEPASQISFGRFNLDNPMAGDPIPENATGYLLRWTQWMVDVKKVDGFRLDAAKHIPSWFFDSFWDAAVYQRRVTPDGRRVTPYSFGEVVDGNDFIFDRHIRKPNGRTSGRLTAGDLFGNRDALDLNGAGQLRNLVNGGGFGSWQNIVGSHLDNTDDGFNNGTLGVNHIWSHDNGVTGDGGAMPVLPTDRQQGWFAHAYLLMRTGQAEVYHHGRGVARTGQAFYPREGVPVALGNNTAGNTANPVITNLVQLANQLGRGEFQPRWTDGDVMIFERRTPIAGGYSGNALIGANDRYDSGFDQRTIGTSFPTGTRLIEMTGNAADPQVDPNNDIPEIITVAAFGQVTIRVPRNVSSAGEHNKGFVVYAPAIPSGAVSFTNIAATLPADSTAVPTYRRRMTSVPVITAPQFEIQLTTTNGDPGAASNDNADDAAFFKFGQGYQDLNGNGSVDVDYTSAVIPGFEAFLTENRPLAGTSNPSGLYRQTINADQLDEGFNYISVVAFRARTPGEAPLFRELREVVYIDREAPQAAFDNPGIVTQGQQITINALDHTVNRIHVIINPAPGLDPVTGSTIFNQAARLDRFDYVRTLSNLNNGRNTLLIVAFEESGNYSAQTTTVFVGCPADWDGSGGVDGDDIGAFFADWQAGNADIDGSGGTDGDDITFFFERWQAGC